VIFSLNRRLSGGTKLTLELADKLGKPALHIYDTRQERIFNPDSPCLEIQALRDFVCSKKIEILNVAGSRESKGPGIYYWTLKMLRLFLNRTPLEQDPQKQPASSRVEIGNLGQPLFYLRNRWLMLWLLSYRAGRF
jgi:hypothetical protein